MHTKVKTKKPMAMENIPYVFELARIQQKCENITLTYDEYSKYSKIYEELPESEKCIVISKVKGKMY